MQTFKFGVGKGVDPNLYCFVGTYKFDCFLIKDDLSLCNWFVGTKFRGWVWPIKRTNIDPGDYLRSVNSFFRFLRKSWARLGETRRRPSSLWQTASLMAGTPDRKLNTCAIMESKSSRSESGTGTSGNFWTWLPIPRTKPATSWTVLRSLRRWLGGPCMKVKAYHGFCSFQYFFLSF